MNRKFVRISLGGVRDEAEIRGHRRTYIGAIPGRIVQALKQAGAMNPVFMLDEIDKITAGFQGDPAAALLEVLDPAQNHSFRDHYLEINIDLSRVLFIATANQLGHDAPGAARSDGDHLAGRLQRRGKAAHRPPVSDPATARGARADAGRSRRSRTARIRRIISDYTREAGVRNLERQIGAVARKIAARVASADRSRLNRRRHGRHRAPDIPDYLGPPRFHDEVAFRVSRPGVATGVAWTETGGDVLFIEARLLPSGHHNLILTGQLGNVMQESARAAVSHIRAQATELGIVRRFSRHARSARPRPGRRDSQGRTVGGRDDGDRDCVGAEESDDPRRRRDDRRDHAERPRAAGRRDPREGARGAAPRHQGRSSCRRATSRISRSCRPKCKTDMRFVPVTTLEEALAVALPRADVTVPADRQNLFEGVVAPDRSAGLRMADAALRLESIHVAGVLMLITSLISVAHRRRRRPVRLHRFRRSARGGGEPAGPLPPSIAALTSMRDQAKPITADERRGRIEKAQRLMAEQKIDAIILAGGTSLHLLHRHPLGQQRAADRGRHSRRSAIRTS